MSRKLSFCLYVDPNLSGQARLCTEVEPVPRTFSINHPSFFSPPYHLTFALSPLIFLSRCLSVTPTVRLPFPSIHRLPKAIHPSESFTGSPSTLRSTRSLSHLNHRLRSDQRFRDPPTAGAFPLPLVPISRGHQNRKTSDTRLELAWRKQEDCWTKRISTWQDCTEHAMNRRSNRSLSPESGYLN